MTTAFSSADTNPGSSVPTRRRLAAIWFSIALSVVFVVASIAIAGSRQVFEHLRRVDTRWLGAASALGGLQLALLGLRWSRVSRELGIPLGWWRATTEYALSLLGNQVLPTGIAGDGLRGVRQAQTSEQSYWAIFEALAIDRASGQLALWLVVLASAPLSARAGIVSWSTLAAGALGAVVVLAALAWVVFRWRAIERYTTPLRPSLARAASLLLSSRALIHLPLSLLLVACSVLQLYVAARALGISLPWFELVWIGPLVLVAASIPSLGGWGFRESACGLSFAAAGMTESAGVAVSVVYGVFALVVSMPAVVVLLFDGQSGSSGKDEAWTYANAASLICGSVLAAWVGYPPLLGFVAGLCCFILVARSQGRWTPGGRFGSPNAITTLRLLLTMALLFAYGREPGWQLAGAAGIILLLDVVDGWVARRTGQSSEFGASYDVEADALLVMSITLLLFTRGTAGAWVLVAGLLRYAYVLAPALFPTPVGQAPRSRHGRITYVTMLTSFMLALVVERTQGVWLALLGTVVITLSFSHSFWQRYAGVRAV
ncbi:MAG TPA: lysylphosphatidylglycerol synthase domain-containing protein [Polyangiaceae bacterium]|nr:lysylphosphatidylglycerol synthase domain-containing protein [Polyangiaceae bacterium]